MASTNIDNYCERIDASFWSEPLNAITNFGFVIAGLFAIYYLSTAKNKKFHLWLLAINMICIGIGSFLFHTFATPWSEAVDKIPIYLFQVIFLWCYCQYALSLKSLTTIGFFVIYVVLTLLTKQIPFNINGSEMYLPTIISLLTFGFAYQYKNKKYDYVIMTAGILFILSLTFRTIDDAICSSLPIGTHFLWHLGNAFVVYCCWLSLYKHAQLSQDTL
ncbi:MAG: ceramidase domain-containing protein [Thalassotalea sp.]